MPCDVQLERTSRLHVFDTEGQDRLAEGKGAVDLVFHERGVVGGRGEQQQEDRRRVDGVEDSLVPDLAGNYIARTDPAGQAASLEQRAHFHRERVVVGRVGNEDPGHRRSVSQRDFSQLNTTSIWRIF